MKLLRVWTVWSTVEGTRATPCLSQHVQKLERSPEAPGTVLLKDSQYHKGERNNGGSNGVNEGNRTIQMSQMSVYPCLSSVYFLMKLLIYIYINNPPVTYEKNNIPFHDMVTWWVNMGQSFWSTLNSPQLLPGLLGLRNWFLRFNTCHDRAEIQVEIQKHLTEKRWEEYSRDM